jgi:DNA-directed RNA polymerase subunit RPC12/RpoP
MPVSQSVYVTTCSRCGGEVRTHEPEVTCTKCGLEIRIEWAWKGEVTRQ